MKNSSKISKTKQSNEQKITEKKKGIIIMSKKNYEYFEEQNEMINVKISEMQAELDKTKTEVSQVEKQLEESLSIGDLSL